MAVIGKKGGLIAAGTIITALGIKYADQVVSMVPLPMVAGAGMGKLILGYALHDHILKGSSEGKMFAKGMFIAGMIDLLGGLVLGGIGQTQEQTI